MTPLVRARCAVLLCVVWTLGVAPPPDESITSIRIVNELTKSIGGEPHTVTERYTITPVGKGFARVDLADNSVHPLAPGVVGNFLRTVKAWRFQAPSPKALWLSQIQEQTLEGNLQKRCGYGSSVATALSAYYGQKVNLTRDYPNVEISVDYGGGKTVTILSYNWQLYGLPWRMHVASGRESLSFDSEISRAVVPLLGDNARNVARFSGLSPVGEDMLSNVAGVACDASKKTS